jgi:hypothetical protein
MNPIVLAACLVCTLPPPCVVDWYTTPGEWAVPYVVEGGPPFTEFCLKATTCHSFMAQVWAHNRTWCFRYLDPKVIHNGREIPGHVTEVGTPGEPGWRWTFQTDEIFTGPFIWKVTTIDVCPKVG